MVCRYIQQQGGLLDILMGLRTIRRRHRYVCKF